jgi:hypothetical protein
MALMRREEGPAVVADAGLQALGAQLVAERDAITTLSDETACRLCGAHAPLTPEHAPSHASGNQGYTVGGRVDLSASQAAGQLVWTYDEDHPDGATWETLCLACNRRTGRAFNPSFVAFSAACKPHARPATARTLCRIAVTNRSLVAKQALVTLLATTQPGLTTRYLHLRTLLAGTNATGPLAPLRLWVHLMANNDARSWYTGLGYHIDRARRAGYLFTSYAAWPLGWVLTIGEAVVPGAADVSAWLQLGKHRAVSVDLPCQWRLLQYPTDFVTPDELRRRTAPPHRVHLR